MKFKNKLKRVRFTQKRPITKSNKFTKKHHFNTDLCDNKMTFQECEVAILRHAIDETEKRQGQKRANSDDIKKMLKIVEEFIIRKKLICYGGTAINNILPKQAQFYNRDIEIPDYDFFSPNALADSKELADIYYEEGYTDVEAKAGMHMGTFKVFVNFIPIADITYMHKDLYNAIAADAILVLNMRYAPPNYLRMAMYLELSRPAGDVSRWEKVMKRLNLLNTYYPLETKDKCHKLNFHQKLTTNMNEFEQIHITMRDSLIDQGVVFFGGYALSLYAKYAKSNEKLFMDKMPNFDVLSEEPEKCATIIKEVLIRAKIKNIKIITHPAFAEIIPEHIEIRVGKQSMAFIYKPIACHSYNEITIDGKTILIATIDTILTFYLSFTYANMPYYDKDRLLCMANFLFDMEQQNRLEQRGLLKRFSIDCYGKQPTMEDIRTEKANKFKELKRDRKSEEYEMWFLKYVPDKIYNKTPTTKLLSSISGDEREHEPDDTEDTDKADKKMKEKDVKEKEPEKEPAIEIEIEKPLEKPVNILSKILKSKNKTKKNKEMVSEFLF